MSQIDVSTRHSMTGDKKAAILLMSMSPEISSAVMKHMSDIEIETLTLHIANLTNISQEEKEHVLQGFYERCLAFQGLQGGGVGFARDLLEKALGVSKAEEILEKISTTVQVTPMAFVKEIDTAQVAAVLANEHPQTIAIVVATMSSAKAAEVLSTLPEETASDVAMRLAVMDRTSPDVIFSIERILEKKLSGSMTQNFTEESHGGITTLVEILNNVDRSTEKAIIESFENINPQLADEVKKRMFVFEDIITLADRGIQLVLQDVQTKELALALKGTSTDVRSKIVKNLSERAAAMLEEEIEYLGPVRLKQVEEAQQGIVAVIRKLEEAGDIVVARGGDSNDIIV